MCGVGAGPEAQAAQDGTERRLGPGSAGRGPRRAGATPYAEHVGRGGRDSPKGSLSKGEEEAGWAGWQRDRTGDSRVVWGRIVKTGHEPAGFRSSPTEMSWGPWGLW